MRCIQALASSGSLTRTVARRRSVKRGFRTVGEDMGGVGTRARRRSRGESDGTDSSDTEVWEEVAAEAEGAGRGGRQ